MTLRTNEMAGKGILGTQRGIKKSTTYILMAVLVLNRWLKKKIPHYMTRHEVNVIMT